MKLTRCENGHFYDEERFSSCPFCNQTSVSTIIDPNASGEGDGSAEKIYTQPLTQATEQEVELKDLVSDVKHVDFQSTVGYYGTSEPVVGWLVSIGGSNFGEDFKLKSGRNFIGRAPDMDVVLSGDPSISRMRHAVIVYEPKSNIFLVQPGDAKELFYLNDKVVLTATEIKAYDVLSLGNTKLLFVPCCSDKFNWDSVKQDEEEKK